MYQPIQFKTVTPLVRYSSGRSLLRRGFLLISLVLACLALSPPAQAQLPNIFAADNPSGSVNSGGANIAYLQNTTGSNVTLTLDGTTITTKANRLNIFDRSSGVWVLRVIQDQQSQPVSPASQVTSNTFLTGLYAYYNMDEASGNAIDASVNGRDLLSGSAVGSVTGVINTARSFNGTNFGILYRNNFTDGSPGANHFFTTFWMKIGTLTQSILDTGLIGKMSFNTDGEWLVYYRNDTHKIRIDVTTDGTTGTQTILESTTAIANTTDWYFIAAGWDGTNIKISVNGGAYATASFAGPVFSGTGTHLEIAAEGGSNYWNGNMDEVAIWIGRNDLTISEVQQLYNNGAGLPFSSFH
jgi:Concanavalin A-like lectin/glucanases superfamily